VGVSAVNKAVKGNLNTRSLTNESEIFKFSKAIENWELKFFGLQGASETATRQNINLWLDEMELTFDGGATNSNIMAGYGGYGISRHTAKLGFDFKTFKEVYKNQMITIGTKDLTQARLLRNSLGFSLGDDQWKAVYAEYDEFIKKSIGMPLDTIKKEFQKKAIYQDSVYFVDSLGRQWRPTAYSEMWGRTRSREIEDIIMTSDMQKVGLDVVQISNASTTTPICLQFEGKFYSKFGQTPELPLLEIFPPFHPNCVHRMIPQRNFVVNMEKSNKLVDKKVANAGFTSAEKKSIRKQETWNRKNR
jgi:hypothetical protein